MVELLSFLAANGFASYIASGGGRDFMRPINQAVYGIPRECVIGSTAELAYISDGHSGTVIHKAEPDYLDDGRRSRWAVGAASAAAHSSPRATRTGTPRCCSSPSTRTNRPCACSSSHDDGEREFDYTAGAEQALEQADAAGWSVVSMKND
jgi:hypothetical protein